MTKPSPPREPTVVMMPVFNDWASLGALLPLLDRSLGAAGRRADVLLIDDGSTLDMPAAVARGPFATIGRVESLRLRRNLGHQRAIAVGLAFLEKKRRPHAVVVMDADGEDDPADVPRLLDRLEAEGGCVMVFAERTRRSESVQFRVFYTLYKLAHRLLTGQGVRVGNFSAIPRRRLRSLVVVGELWSHYAAAAIRSRQPYVTIPTRRATRLDGHSSMNFVSLVAHGLGAIAVYGDVVGVRLLVLAAVVGLLGFAGLVGSVVIRLATPWAIPGWATFTGGLSLSLLVQALMLAMCFSLLILGSRTNATVIPRRDFALMVGRLRTLHDACSPVTAPERPRALRGPARGDRGAGSRADDLLQDTPLHPGVPPISGPSP